MSNAPITKKINAIADTLIAKNYLNQSHRDTVRLVVGAMMLGSNADKLAEVLGLSRDNFVRPVSRRMRENGLWTRGQSKVDSDTDDNLALEVVLHVGCANGSIRHAQGRYFAVDENAPVG